MNLLSDSEIQSLVKEHQSATPERQQQIADQFAQDKQLREYNAGLDSARRMFEQPNDLGGQWTDEQRQSARLVGEDEEQAKKRFANIALIAAQKGAPRDEVAAVYEPLRDSIAQEFWGKQEVSDDEFYSKVQINFQQQKQRQAKLQELASQGASAALEDVLSGKAQDWGARLNALDPSNPPDPSDPSDPSDPEAASIFRDAYNRSAELGAANRELFDAAKMALGQETGRLDFAKHDPLATLDTAAERIAALDPEEKQAVFGMLTLYAKQNGAKGINDFFGRYGDFAENVYKTTKRETQRLAINPFDMGYESKLLAAKKELESDGPVYLSGKDASLSSLASLQGSFSLADAGANFAPWLGSREATPEERKALKSEVNKALKTSQVLRELRHFAETEVDPVKAVLGGGRIGATAENALYMFAGSAPIMAGAMASLPLTAISMTGTTYEDMRVRYPDLAPEKAAAVATVAGPLMAGAFKLNASAVLGKLPALGAVFEKLATPTSSFWKRFAIGTGLETVEQGVLMKAAEFIPAAAQQVVGALDKDIPEVKWDDVLTQSWRTMPETLFMVLPLALFGAGRLAANESARVRQIMTDPKAMEAFAIKPEDAAQISQLARAGDSAGAESLFRQKWQTRSKAEIEAAGKAMAEKVEQAKALQESPETSSVRARQDGSFEILDRNGKVSSVHPDEHSAALAWTDKVAGEINDPLQAQAMGELKSFLEAKDPQQRIELINKSRFLSDALSEKAATPEQIAERMRVAGAKEGESPENFRVLGESVTEVRDGIRQGVARLYEGANVSTMIEEVAHGRLTRAIESGRLPLEDVVAAVGEWSKRHKEFELREDMTTEQRNTVLQEAVADMVKAKFFGNMKLIEGLPKSVRAFVAKAVVLFREIIKRAATLKRMEAEGKLTKNVTEFLAESVGLKADHEVAIGTLEAAGEIAGGKAKFSIVREADYTKAIADKLEALKRNPTERLAIYERAKATLTKAAQRSAQAMEKLSSEGHTFEKIEDSKSYIKQEQQRSRDQILADLEIALNTLESQERQEISKFGQENTARYMDRIESAKTEQTKAALKREAETRATERTKAIKQKYAERKKAERETAQLQIEKANQAIKSEAYASKAKSENELGRVNMLQSLSEYNAVLSAFPPEVRGSVGGYVRLAELKTDRSRGKFITERIQRADRALERILQSEYRDRIETLLEQSKPKRSDKGVKKSTLGPEVQALADAARKASLLDADATSERLKQLSDRIAAGDTSPQTMMDWGVVNAFGDLANRSSDQLAQAHQWLADSLKKGRDKQRMLQEARFVEIRARQAGIVNVLGKATVTESFKAKHKGFLGKTSELIGDFYREHLSFEQFLKDALPGMDGFVEEMFNRLRKADNGAMDMANADLAALMDTIKNAAKDARKSMGKAMEDLKTIHQSVALVLEGRMVKDERIKIELAEKIVRGEAHPGKLSREDIQTLREELEALPPNSRREYVEIKRVIAKGEMTPLSMSREDAMQILLSWRQRDVQEKMRRGGWTDETIADLSRFVSSDPVAVAAFNFLKEFYAKGAERMNPVYTRMFGMNMPQIENYAPTRFKHGGAATEIGPDGSPSYNGSTPSMLVARVSHSAQVAAKGALDVFRGHVLQQAHWVNFAELARDFRAVFSNADVRNSLSLKYGDSVLRQFDRWAEYIEKRGGNQSNEAAFIAPVINSMIGGRAISSLGFNPRVWLMQADSAARFVLSLSTREIASAFSNPVELAKAMPKVWFSEPIQRRLKHGMNPETQYLFTQSVMKPGLMSKLAHNATGPINFVDAAFTTVGGAAVFKSAYDNAIKSGLSQKLAEAHALDALDAAIYRFSQPVGFGSKPLIANASNSMFKLWTLFMGDPMLKTALMAEAGKGIITGRGDRLKHFKTLMAIEMMSLSSQALANAYRDMFTDDPDNEIWTAGGFARAALLAPFQGYFMVGTMADSIISKITQEKWFAPSRDPLSDTISRVQTAIANRDDATNTSDPEAMVKEWEKISRSLALHPYLAAPATLLNLIKPFIGAKKNAEKEE